MSKNTHLPTWVYIPAMIGLAGIVVPLLGLLPRVEWSTFISDITTPETASALWLSVRSAFFAVLACVVMGLPLAMVIARAPERIAVVLRTVVTLPLVLPPLVGGVALLTILGKTGMIGGVLEGLGVGIPFTPAAVSVAQTFVAMPFLVIAVESALRANGVGYENIAATLGSRPHHTLRRITLPLIAPGLGAGIVLAFARAVGEFGATALVAGNQPGYTQTIPMAIYTAFNGVGTTRQGAMALSVLLIITSLVILIAFPAARGARPSRAASPALTEEGTQQHPPSSPTRLTPGQGKAITIDVSYARNGFHLDATFNIAPGQVVAVVGPNGAGKTTLINLIAGMLTPTQGSIAIGEDIRITPDDAPPPWQREVSLLAQEPLLFPHLNVGANVEFGPRARNLPTEQTQQQAHAFLHAVGLPHAMRRKVSTLSGGQQQRVALARALAVNPRLLLLDEPLGQVDVATAPGLRQTLKTLLTHTNTTTLLVTHNLLDVVALADHVIVLDQGQIVESQSKNDFLTHPRSPFGALLTGINVLPDPSTGESLRFEPHHLALSLDPSPQGAHGIRWEGEVEQVHLRGTSALVYVQVGDLTIQVTSDVRKAALLAPAQKVEIKPIPRNLELNHT